jgi:HEAT repeat protein
VSTLLELLSDPEDSELRATAAKVLGRLNQQDAAPVLISALKDEDNDVRLAAIRALAELGSPAALGPLEHLQQEEGWRSEPRQIRNAVQSAIKRIRLRQQRS